MRAMIAGVHTISYCNFTGSRFTRTNLCKATDKLKFVYDATSRFIRSNFHFFLQSQCCSYVLVRNTFHLVRVRKTSCFGHHKHDCRWPDIPSKISDNCHHKHGWKFSHVSLNISSGLHWNAVRTATAGLATLSPSTSTKHPLQLTTWKSGNTHVKGVHHDLYWQLLLDRNLK